MTINATTHYLWRAVDQHGNVLDILVQSRRTAVAAKRFFRQLLKGLHTSCFNCVAVRASAVSLPSPDMASRSPNTERSSWLTHEEYIGALREQAARFATVLRHSASDAPVPSCPDWTALDLVRHVVQVYAHKAAVLRAGKAVPDSDVEAADDATFSEALERHDAVVVDLIDLLAELDPEAPAWTWMEGAGESTVGAWARRMAHEALMHRVDASSPPAWR